VYLGGGSWIDSGPVIDGPISGEVGAAGAAGVPARAQAVLRGPLAVPQATAVPAPAGQFGQPRRKPS
jgi:hypothetical protein